MGPFGAARIIAPGSRRRRVSVATFVPKDWALSPAQIRLAFHQRESIATGPAIRLALRVVMLTLMRKSELIEVAWSEIDFGCDLDDSKAAHEGAQPPCGLWQALGILVALHM